MPRFRNATLFLVLLLTSALSFLIPCWAQSNESSPAKSLPAAPSSGVVERMAKQTRYEIIRDFETQVVYARTAFPMGKKGLVLRRGIITPNGEELSQELSLWGPALKPGDPAQISLVQIKEDHIHLEINGGPIRHKKWYQRVEVSGTGGTPVANPGADQTLSNPHGSFVNLYFDRYVPELTAQQVRDMLYPVLDFKARNPEQAYLDTVPSKVKEAILAHHVLVGMNQEMVLHAKGKPPRKVRERDGDTQYEEWIYGEPPADVDFVRLVGDEVVRVETMKIDGEKIVRTEKEIELAQPDKDKDKEAKKEPGERPSAPSLRLPGEDPANVPKPSSGQNPLPPMLPPDAPQAPGGAGPGELVAAR